MIVTHDIDQAVEILRRGGVIVYPTETSYALGCDATNDAAVAKVFAIKGRPEGKGIPLILPDDIDVSAFVEMSARALKLAKQHWPGPLNIVAKRATSSSVSLRCETDGTQSVRQSSSALASELARQLGRPLVATSANRSGEAAIYRVDELKTEFFGDEQPDAVLDGGHLPVVPASTTIKIEGDKLEIVRQGVITLATNLI